MAFDSSYSIAAEWEAAEARLDKVPRGTDFNTGHEVCSRYANSSTTALTVVHADGSRDRWSYAELDRLAAKMARLLANAGLTPGDRVAGLLSRRVEKLDNCHCCLAFRPGVRAVVRRFCGRCDWPPSERG